jgi:sulfite exporter TauE/SafE
MCGPLLLAQNSERWSHWAYQTGRGLSYITLGAIAGSIGQGLSLLAIPNWLSWGFILALLVLIGHGTWQLLRGHEVKMLLPSWISSRQARLASWWLGHGWLKGKGPVGLKSFGFGLGTVLLPCGQIALFVLAAAISGSAISGAFVMVLLWVAGWPVSLLAHWGRRGLLRTALSIRLRQGFAVVFAMVGIWGVLGFADRLERLERLDRTSSGASLTGGAYGQKKWQGSELLCHPDSGPQN